jgi:hypothetical protein
MSFSIAGYEVQGKAASAIRKLLGHKSFNSAMDDIQSLAESSIPDSIAPSRPTVPDNRPSIHLTAEALILQNLQQGGKGSHGLRLYFPNAADVSVSDVAAFVENSHGRISRGLIDGFIERLCIVQGSPPRGCQLSSKIWDMMISRDAQIRTLLARMVQALSKHKSCGATFVLIPLFISDMDWFLVVVYFSGTVCVVAPYALHVPSKALQSVRQLMAILGLPPFTLEVQQLGNNPANSIRSFVMLQHAYSLFFHNSDNPRSLGAADFDRFAQSLLLFVLGLSTSLAD